jgi:hypothetical protein
MVGETKTRWKGALKWLLKGLGVLATTVFLAGGGAGWVALKHEYDRSRPGLRLAASTPHRAGPSVQPTTEVKSASGDPVDHLDLAVTSECISSFLVPMRVYRSDRAYYHPVQQDLHLVPGQVDEVSISTRCAPGEQTQLNVSATFADRAYDAGPFRQMVSPADDVPREVYDDPIATPSGLLVEDGGAACVHVLSETRVPWNCDDH